MSNYKITYFLFMLLGIVACSVLQARETQFLRPPEYYSYYDRILPFSELETVDLAGEWLYRQDKAKDYRPVLLPASWENYSGRVYFRKSFTFDASSLDKQVRLISLGISRRCRVLLNDEFITEQEGPYIDVILPNKLFRKNSENILEIEVDNELSPTRSIPLLSGAIIPENYGGITGDIFLVIENLPNIAVQSVEVVYDQTAGSGEINLKASILKSHLQNTDLSLSMKLMTPEDREISSNSLKLGKDIYIENELTLQNPLTWSIEDPILYRLEISITDGQEIISQKNLNIGFRKFEASGEIRLNGEKIQLKGIKYRPVHRQGFTFSAEDYERDLELIVATGANTVLINDPPHPYLIKLCDESGVLVFQSNSVETLPNAILRQVKFQTLLKNRVNGIYGNLHHHVSICGWLIGLGLQPDFMEYINSDNSAILHGSNRFAGVVGEDKKIVMVSSGTAAEIVYDIGAVLLNDDEKQQLLQVSILSEDLDRWQYADGIFIREFADYKSGREILFQQTEGSGDKLYNCGLVERSRSPRIAFRELQRGWFDREVAEHTHLESKEELLFPIFGFGLLLIIIVYTRSNHVFRVQLVRVFNHPHGFYHDVKNKRFIQKMQTFILGFGAILVMALISSALFYSLRYSITFDFLTALLFQNSPLHQVIITIVNDARISILYMSVFYLISLLIVTCIFKITTLITGQYITLGQSMTYTCWAGANFLLLAPLTVVFYKGLSYGFFAKLEIFILSIFLCWTLFRLLNALKVAASASMVKVLLSFAGIHLLLLVVVGIVLQYQSSFIQYTGYFFKILI